MKNRIYILACLAALIFTGPVWDAGAQNDFKLGSSSEILINIFRELNLYYVDETDPEEMVKNAANGITSKLDPYTEYMPAENMADFEVLTTGKYGGIGALIRKKGDYVVIAQPYQNFPADKAGLKAGDVIMAIDGKDAKNFETAQVSNLLKGDPGTTVNVKIRKFDTDEIQDIKIKRERIVISGIPYYGFINDSIGYIIHSDFTEDCSSDMRHAIMEMKKTGNLKGLVLDYRGNGGGILQEAVKILSFFVPRGTEVVSMKGKYSETSASFKTESEPIDLNLPLAVLIDGGSASAAEIVAGALQDLDRAVLIGQRTYGKGLVQSTRPVGYDAYVKVTTAKYYMPSGRCIQAIDYAQRNEDGSVVYVPDSLITEFSTLNGRKVYDGGGIMPDLRTPAKTFSKFTFLVYSLGYFDEFTDDYHKGLTRDVKVGEFAMTDEEFDRMVTFLESKDIKYQSETMTAFNTMKARAEKEGYSDQITEYLNAIESLVKDDTRYHAYANKDEIRKLVEDEIIMREHYARGVTLHNIPEHEEISLAVETLGDAESFNITLKEKNTDKK